MVIPPVAHADHHHPERQTSTWTYDTSTTMADPGSGKVRGNSTGEPQTQIAISHINSNGTSVSLWIEAIAAGDRIRFQEAANSDTWAIYNITAVAHNSGWSLLDVSRTSVGPGEEPKKNASLLVTVEYAGSGGGGSEQGYKFAQGTVTTDVITAPTDRTATFPSGLFANAPKVFTQAYENQSCYGIVKSVTKDSAVITIRNVDGATASVIGRLYWFAIGT